MISRLSLIRLPRCRTTFNLQTGNFELKIDPTSDMTIWNANVTNEFAVDTMKANGANQLTINDNVTITGNLTVNGTNNIGGGSAGSPFWVACMVNGSTLSILSSQGSQDFTVIRPSVSGVNTSAGVFRIGFPAHPSGNEYNTVLVTNLGNYNIKVWDYVAPTSTSFSIVSYVVVPGKLNILLCSPCVKGEDPLSSEQPRVICRSFGNILSV